MSAPAVPSPTPAPAASSRTPGGRRRAGRNNSLLAHGEPSVWLTGGGLTVAVAMIVGLLLFVAAKGGSTFWPGAAIQVRTVAGKTYLGEVTRDETYRPDADVFDSLPKEARAKARAAVERAGGVARRRQLQTGNFDLTGTHRHWVSDFEIVEESEPEWGLVIERLSWGNFYGTPVAFGVDGKIVAGGTHLLARAIAAQGFALPGAAAPVIAPAALPLAVAAIHPSALQVDAADPPAVWAKFNEHIDAVHERLDRRIGLERHDLGEVKRRHNEARLEARQAEISYGKRSPEAAAAAAHFEEVKQWAEKEETRIKVQIDSLNRENARFQMCLVTATGEVHTLSLGEIVRAYPANRLGTGDKWGIYLSRWGEFLTERPRSANAEGGVFPAIFGTVAMTLLMSLVVVPFGVLAALYLREYARSGAIISAVRIAINNLAGVPSIVFGVFGFGFFCYLVGAFIDGGPQRIQVAPWPPLAWWLVLTAVVVVGFVAFCVGLAAGRARRTGARFAHWLGRGAIVLWLACVAAFVILIVKNPHFHGFYQADLPSPTFGGGGLLWSALTLALLTLPVVIVATEEALAAVPNSMREGSYACGASKWQTIRRIVLPRAMPGILTGMILAMARGAGEVAPLMLVGAVKLAPELPVDGVFPYVHASRSYMHLGFHIYDLGFQTLDSEAARPMLFTTTLLLIAIVALLNLAAVWLRSRLRRRYLTSQF